MRVATLFIALCVVLVAGAELAAAQVYEKIFGYDYIGHGFNAVTGENTLLPILELTYDLDITWQNPLVPDQVMQVPDQVGVLDLPVGMGKNSSSVFTDVYDYTEEVRACVCVCVCVCVHVIKHTLSHNLILRLQYSLISTISTHTHGPNNSTCTLRKVPAGVV
jgi:hypothetical protein